jgi:hypothetical protein
MNEFVAMLPFCDQAEAEGIMKQFVQDFQKGIQDIGAGARERTLTGACVEFSVLGGVAQGQPVAEIGEIIELAIKEQREIGRFKCDGGE